MKVWFLLLGLAGCSITLSGPDANRPQNKAPQCDSGKGLIALDAALGAVAGISAIALAGSNGSAAVLPAALGVAFVASAVHGNSVVDACRKANDEYAAVMERAPLAPIVAERPEPLLPTRRSLPQSLPQPEEPQPAPQPQAQPPQPTQPQAAQQTMPWAAFWKEVR